MNSTTGFELFESLMNTGVCKTYFYYIKIKTTLVTSIINVLLAPTDFHFILDYVILIC